jgi:hypothetical protein
MRYLSTDGRGCLSAMDYEKIDLVRRHSGFLTIAETIKLIDTNNQIFDPFSVLIGSEIEIGIGNIFYPGTTLLSVTGHTISIGDRNIFYSGCLLEATHGEIRIGDDNQFGEGGFTAKANRSGSHIQIGNSGRFLNNPSVFGETTLGDGTQILGRIQVDSCRLDSGGGHNEPDPDKRGGLLKGSGVARNLHVPIGHVISAQGDFADGRLLPQLHFHPKR